jgi:hypothetical protein
VEKEIRMTIKKKTKWILAGALGAICLAAVAGAMLVGSAVEPNLALAGVVTDAATGEPIPGATVGDDEYGKKPYQSGVSDASGAYAYATWVEEHSIVARAPGYTPKRQTLMTSFWQRETEAVLDFVLEPE